MNENEENVKLLGINIGSSLSFDDHINSVCTRACQKLSTFTRISNYMNIGSRRHNMKVFIRSNIGYCSLIWMFCSFSLDNQLNHMHEKALHVQAI